MRKIYISGKISGREPDARVEFAHAKRLLEAAGYRAVNPFSNGLGPDDPWERHLAADLHALLGCDALVQLPGWEDSRGARLEAEFAAVEGIAVYGPDAFRSLVGLHQGDTVGDTKAYLMVRDALSRRLEDVGLSRRAYNCLVRDCGLITLADLAACKEKELSRLRNFGKGTMLEVKTLLERMGLSLGMKTGEYGFSRRDIGKYNFLYGKD